jgi:NO-binding membrane sensor protein with MHYT domain
VAVLGSFTALQLAVGIPGARGLKQRLGAVTAAGATMGGAIWAMHFIAMLACQMPFQVSYDVGLTALSALLAIVSCSLGLALSGVGVFTWPKLVSAGVYMGIGVAGMHYLGMAAMRMPATTLYQNGLVALSVVIGIVASIAALWLAFNMRGKLQMFGSALVMGVAVCGMHYTGMAAVSFVADDSVRVASGGLQGDYLGMTIFVVAVVLLTVALVLSFLRQQRRQTVAI